MPEVYVISGPNGAGKTTIALTILPSLLETFEYVNADLIASGLSAFQPESVAIQAGRIMLERLDLLANSGVNFAFETTLAARSFAPFLRKCQVQGYQVNLIYVWLDTPELAIERVQQRVLAGGHAIPVEIIRHRYDRGRKNLVDLYLKLCDNWIIYDNSQSIPRLVATFSLNEQLVLFEPTIWKTIIRREND
jgi:predicted ABC-type ATPase